MPRLAQDHFGQAGERAARADQHVRRKHRLAGVLAERLVDQPHEFGKAFAGQVARGQLAHPHGAQRRGEDLLDGVAGGQDDLGAAAADIGHGHVLAFQAEVADHAEERQLGFLLRGDDLDVQPGLGLHAADEVRTVGRFPHGARGDGLHFTHLIAGRNLLHMPQHRQGVLYRVGVQMSCGGQSLAQTRGFLFFVQNAIVSVPQGFRHDQSNAVGADIDAPPADGPGPARGRSVVPCLDRSCRCCPCLILRDQPTPSRLKTSRALLASRDAVRYAQRPRVGIRGRAYCSHVEKLSTFAACGLAGTSYAFSNSAEAHVHLRSYLQLIRLPNVFTAMADVLMGYLVTHNPAPLPTLNLPAEFWLLLAASSCLYCAGMVLNDVNDIEVDRHERPHRPLPSGASPWASRGGLGYALLALGVGLASLAGFLSGQIRSSGVAILLALAIVLYDGLLKRTPLAPLVMGCCRMLNVLLGMSALAGPWHPMHYVIAAGVGTYIVGVTWFARTEARQSYRVQLALGIAVMLGGIALLASYPTWADPTLAEVSWPRFVLPDRWPLVWGVIGLMIGWRCLWAVIDPITRPRAVCRAELHLLADHAGRHGHLRRARPLVGRGRARPARADHVPGALGLFDLAVPLQSATEPAP